MKLSCMHLPLINALWLGEMRDCIRGVSRKARILDMIFANACMRLIGLKSVIKSAPSFFGTRMTFVVLSRSRSAHRRLLKELMAALTSCFMIF